MQNIEKLTELGIENDKEKRAQFFKEIKTNKENK